MSTSLSVTGLQGWLHSAQISPLTPSLSLPLLHLFQRYVCSVLQLVTWLAKLCLHVWYNMAKSMWTPKHWHLHFHKFYIPNASRILASSTLCASSCVMLTQEADIVLEGHCCLVYHCYTIRARLHRAQASNLLTLQRRRWWHHLCYLSGSNHLLDRSGFVTHHSGNPENGVEAFSGHVLPILSFIRWNLS